jgi:hypothetical protein
LGWKKVKTPMFHWGQGTMFKALVHLLSKTPGDAQSLAQHDSEFAGSPQRL